MGNASLDNVWDLMNPPQVLCSTLILFEIAAVVALLQGSPPQESAIYLFFCVHVGVSGMLALVTAQRTSVHGAASYGYSFANFSFFFCIAFLVPLIGSCICLVALARRIRSPPEEDRIQVDLTGSPVLASGWAVAAPIHLSLSTGSDISGILKNAEQKERRLAALITARDLPGPYAMKVIRLALTDSEDEVRLLAYTMLSVKEEELQGRVQTLTDQLATVAPGRRLFIHRALAHTYWEMVYLGLSTGVIESFVLEAAREQVEAGQREAPRDASLRLLLGRICMRQGRLDQATMAFNQARELGIDFRKIEPFLEEISFMHDRINSRTAAISNVTRPLHSASATAEAADETPAYASYGAPG